MARPKRPSCRRYASAGWLRCDYPPWSDLFPSSQPICGSLRRRATSRYRRAIDCPLGCIAGWIRSRNESVERPNSASLASIFALVCTASVWVRPENMNPSPIRAARSYAAWLKPPNQIGILRLGRGNIPVLSIRWSVSSCSTTACSHSFRIKAICCSCRLPRRRKCPDISSPSYPPSSIRRRRPAGAGRLRTGRRRQPAWRTGPFVAEGE